MKHHGVNITTLSLPPMDGRGTENKPEDLHSESLSWLEEPRSTMGWILQLPPLPPWMGEVLKTSERACTVRAYLGWKHHGVNITTPPTTLPPLPAWNASPPQHCPKVGCHFSTTLTLWLLSALFGALPNKVHILSQKRLRKAPYFVKWHFMILIWSCLWYYSISIGFSPFSTNFLAIFPRCANDNL